MVQVQSLIPRDVEVQRLKKLYIQIILMLSLTIVAVITYSMDTSLNQSMIRDSAFTPANWLLYSVFIVLPLGWGLNWIFHGLVPDYERS